MAVVAAWAETDPAQAAQWVGQLPESPLRAQAMKQLMSSWAADNTINEASQWLRNLPYTPSRDSAVGAFSKAIASISPATAYQWAGTISNEAERNQRLKSIASAWRKQDPAAASTILSKLREQK